MKTLVTGAGGFIASHLVEELVRKGHEVRAFVRYNSRNLWGWLEEAPCRDGVEIISGDIRNHDLVSSAVEGCEAVFHLAALIGAPSSSVSPLAYVRTNVEGTDNVLQAALEKGVRRVVHVSTSEIYGTGQNISVDESHPFNPQSPYAVSRVSADFLALSYYRSFDLPVSIARPFDVYGPRQSGCSIISAIIGELLEGKRRISLASLPSVSDLTYVTDIVSGLLSIEASPETVGKTLNLGTGNAISAADLGAKIASAIGCDIEIIEDELSALPSALPSADEQPGLISNPEKMHALTGWKAQIDLDEGLRRTVEWMKEHRRL